jgi:hypothetical protein
MSKFKYIYAITMTDRVVFDRLTSDYSRKFSLKQLRYIIAIGSRPPVFL